MDKNYTIRDPIHGDINISKQELEIIDNPEFQRLRKVKQLGMAYLVYPGATHTRFEHSLGTMAVTGNLAEKLGVSSEEKSVLRIAALLHDIGHPAFSHDGESVLGIEHEKMGWKIITSSEIIEIAERNCPRKELEKVFMGKGLGTAISSSIGSDRIDYLLRDAHNTGVAYGIIDRQRIAHTLIRHGERILLKKEELGVIESLLLARFMMFMNVYNHKTVRICSAMLKRMLEDGIREGILAKEELYDSDESTILGKMEENALGKDLAERKLWKKIGEVKLGIGPKQVGGIERELEEKLGQKVIAEVPFFSYKATELRVGEGKEGIDVEELSPLIRSLKKAEKQRLKIIFIAKEHGKDTLRIAKKITGDYDDED